MSREALSLEISQAVSRVVSGEPVDAAERGAFLAAKYPELGMSGEMISEAITPRRRHDGHDQEDAHAGSVASGSCVRRRRRRPRR